MVAGAVVSGGRNLSNARLTASLRLARKSCKSKFEFGTDRCWLFRPGMRVSCRQRLPLAQADLTNLILLSRRKSLSYRARSNTLENALNSELARKALEKVGNPNV